MWTKEQPVKPGIYWVVRLAQNHKPIPSVEITQVMGMSDKPRPFDYTDCEWYSVPVTPPEGGDRHAD